MKSKTVFLLVLFASSCSLMPKIATGEAVNHPLITDIQIAGEKSSDDYIKIYNPTDSDIYFGNYEGSYIRLVKRARTSNKDYTIKSWAKDSQTKILAKGTYLWANKDFIALPNVDIFTSQTISVNNGIALRLGPADAGPIIDAVGFGDFGNVLFEGGVFPDNPKPNQKLTRKQNSGIYQDTDNNSLDFYLNSVESALPNESQQRQKIQSNINDKVQPEKLLIYPSGIIINEVLPSPEGPDEKEEWIEIFSQNSFEADLSGWKIEDASGKITTYTFPKETKISPQGFLVISRPASKISLNNDGDGLNLIQPNGTIIDSVTYQKAPRGQSYNRTGDSWGWSATLTPGKPNTINSSREEPKNKQSQAASEKSHPKNELATVSSQLQKPLSFFFVFVIAFCLAIFSGITMLTLKRKFES